MSRRSLRISLLFAFLLSSEVWAIGLGDIRLDSALNEPFRAEIVLLAATPEEIAELKVRLASEDDFARYDIDRPFYLQDVEFNVVNRGATGSVVQIRTRAPVTEPFLTFLVEATWPSGRLLREYTVLLDPPTFTPPGAEQAPAVQAPLQQTPVDSARIERDASTEPSTTQPVESPGTPSPSVSSQSDVSKPQPPLDDTPYDTTTGDDLYVNRGDTLWGIAARMRPDSRLTMNQMMLAIYESNRDAFGGNINMLRAGVSLRIPSADEVFQISRGIATDEVKRQNESWTGVPTAEPDYGAPADTTTSPSLVLVPPDEEPDTTLYDDTPAYEPYSREQEIEDRIATLESEELPEQQSLIEIRDNELAELRQELAEIRGEVYEPPVDDTPDVTTDDDITDEQIFADDVADEAAVDDDPTADDACRRRYIGRCCRRSAGTTNEYRA